MYREKVLQNTWLRSSHFSETLKHYSTRKQKVKDLKLWEFAIELRISKKSVVKVDRFLSILKVSGNLIFGTGLNTAQKRSEKSRKLYLRFDKTRKKKQYT